MMPIEVAVERLTELSAHARAGRLQSVRETGTALFRALDRASWQHSPNNQIRSTRFLPAPPYQALYAAAMPHVRAAVDSADQADLDSVLRHISNAAAALQPR